MKALSCYSKFHVQFDVQETDDLTKYDARSNNIELQCSTHQDVLCEIITSHQMHQSSPFPFSCMKTDLSSLNTLPNSKHAGSISIFCLTCF